MYDPKTIAAYFIRRNDPHNSHRGLYHMGNLKLQKLLYFAQGLYAMEYNKELMNTTFQHSKYVVSEPITYQLYKSYNYADMTQDCIIDSGEVISDADLEFLDKTWSALRQFHGKHLEYVLRNLVPYHVIHSKIRERFIQRFNPNRKD